MAPTRPFPTSAIAPESAASRDAVLLTGVTGFVGTELLSRYVERGTRHVYALVRAGDAETAARRLDEIITGLYGDPDFCRGRVTAVPGDIEQAGLGLDPRSRAELTDRVAEIVHCAASVSFSLPLDQARAINVDGTRRMLELAQDCAVAGDGLRRFAHLSTAYVAGDHGGEFCEDDLEVGQGFRNSYERSKFEAERLVHDHSDHLPIQVFRPSIIVGERATGWTSSFNVLYPPLRALARGAYPAIPGSASTPVDVVPVDYVADGVFELSQQPLDGNETHHLVAGREATSAGRIAAMAGRYFGCRPPVMLPPRVYRWLVGPLVKRMSAGRRRRALERTEMLFPYFSMRVRFDASRARSRLQPAGVRFSPLESYFERLLDFAVGVNWGRRAVGRARADAVASAAAAS